MKDGLPLKVLYCNILLQQQRSIQGSKFCILNLFFYFSKKKFRQISFRHRAELAVCSLEVSGGAILCG
jgi:hypothetical protein